MPPITCRACDHCKLSRVGAQCTHPSGASKLPIFQYLAAPPYWCPERQHNKAEVVRISTSAIATPQMKCAEELRALADEVQTGEVVALAWSHVTKNDDARWSTRTLNCTDGRAVILLGTLHIQAGQLSTAMTSTAAHEEDDEDA